MLLVFLAISLFQKTQSLGCANLGVGTCLDGKCPSGYVCVDGDVSFCCEASLVMCDKLFGECVGGECPGNATCGYQNQCCPITCPKSQNIGPCMGDICAASSTCIGGVCCASSVPQCQNNIGPCIDGKCATGYACDGSSCCCADSSDRCSDWTRQGFCNSTIFSDQDKLLCSKSCGLC